MLGGHSPFHVAGDNGQYAITTRVRTQPVPPLGRRDVPESLERILRTAMAKEPGQRYTSALEFARALQGVQAELRLSVTTIDVKIPAGPAPIIMTSYVFIAFMIGFPPLCIRIAHTGYRMG